MNVKHLFFKVDSGIIETMRKLYFPGAKFAIFLIFFWFGLLKVLGLSPAGPMVLSLLDMTLPFMNPDTFMVLFGLFEMLIGLLFLIPHVERLAILLLAIHMITTILPLFLLPDLTWASSFVPTMEGQYIIKNVLIIALAMGIAAHLKPGKI